MNRLGPFEENTIVVGDCLDIMAQMPDGCVDYIFTDPPYNKGKDYGIADDNLSMLEYLGLAKESCMQMARISRGGFSIFLPAYHIQSWWLNIPDADLVIIPKRANGIIQGHWRQQYFGVLTTAKPIVESGDRPGGGCPNLVHVRLPGEGYVFTEERWPHPGFTSQELTTYFVRLFSDEDDIVADFFIGSGTTAVVADRLGRKFFGCDINPDYVEMTLERLEKDRAGRQLTLL